MTAAVFLKGFLLGASLIIAIGPQNAFILRQGLQRRHVFVCALTASLIDAVLIVGGIAGLSAVLAAMPWFIAVIKFGGAAFLFFLGVKSFRRAWQHESLTQSRDPKEVSVKQAITTLLGFSLLNPHVYLDTVIMLGGIGAAYVAMAWRIEFGVGATSASFAWFFGLAYGARLLAPVFAKPRAWQVLDILIGIVMWSIAIGLLRLKI